MSVRAAVMGWPVAHSLSPRLHGYWLKYYGIDGHYDLLPVEPQNIGEALRHLHDQGFVGVNLTVPHKELVLPYLTRIDPLAQRVGAVNTVVVRNDASLDGYNTDVFGFSQNILHGGFVPGQRPVALLGAGGAARSAIVALLDLGIPEVRIVNRTQARALELAGEFGNNVRAFAWNDPSFLKNVALLANATSLGMTGQPPLVLDLEALPHDAIVTDMVYAPLMTDILVRAAHRGNITIDGLGMLLHQARPAFQAFFGIDPEVTPSLRAHVLDQKT